MTTNEELKLLCDLGNNCLDREDLEFIENEDGEQFLSMKEVERACLYGYHRKIEEIEALEKYKECYEVMQGYMLIVAQYMLIVAQYSDDNDYVMEKIEEASRKCEQILGEK